MASERVPAIRLFYCYADADKSLCEELDKHLIPLKRLGWIECWHDQMISPGSEWELEIERQLSSAQIILLLVSPDFLASYYCYEKEMKLALQRHEAGVARIIPIILRHSGWKDAPFGMLQVLPADERPIANWPNHDEFFVNVVDGIRKVVSEIITEQGSSRRDVNRGYQRTSEIVSSTWPDQTLPSGKYKIRANEVKTLVQGDNFGTVNNHGLDLSDLVKLRDLLRDDSAS